MWRQSGVWRHDYDEVESAREIGPVVYVGGDSAFLKDRVRCKCVSGKWIIQCYGSFSRNQMEPCSSSWCLCKHVSGKWIIAIKYVVAFRSNTQWPSRFGALDSIILLHLGIKMQICIPRLGCFKFVRCSFKGSMVPCSLKISRGVNKVPFDVCHITWCTKVRSMLFLCSRTILRADPDLKIGPKLKIVNDIVTSITGKRGKMRLACMNSLLHGSCKFDKFYLIHANKRRAVQSHYSMSSNYYQ
jgi:hypothetical protein